MKDVKKFNVLVEFITTIEARTKEEAEMKAVEMIHGPCGIEQITSSEE